jgi:ParB family transcriptional regulator, chromosome partitioning protein
MNKPDTSRRALGKGISALLPTRTPAPPLRPEAPAHEDAAQNIPVATIDPNPLQPRRAFQSERLAELAQSIRANGIIQPLVVRKVGDRYQLVAGERRLRAAKLAELKTVPVVVQEIPDERLLEITLIENIQREDLNPMETAAAFDQMSRELKLLPEEIGQRTGKDRSTIVNAVRLLQLPQDIQKLVAEGLLTAGHARCLLKLPNSDMQRAAAAKVAEQDWSVRQLERATAKMMEGGGAKSPSEPAQDPNVKAAIDELERSLGTKVRIVEAARGKGRIEIEYYSQEDLDRIYEMIVGTGA